jgi:threonine dehydratase
VITIDDVYEAQSRIKGIAARTPLQSSLSYSMKTNAEVSLKLECYQPIRVFKIRGAANKIKSLRNVTSLVAASGGNHGLAVSYIANKLGLGATVCVPSTANPDKMADIRKYGAELVNVGTSYEDAYAEAIKIRDRSGATLVHPFEDPLVVAGQGTIGLEMLEDLPDIETVLAPVGGGGLISGTALALKSLKSKIRVIGVQASNAPAMARAFKAGRPVPTSTKPTIADGLATKLASQVTLQVIQKYVDDIVLVEERMMKEAVISLLRNEHILSEPSGAAALAALLHVYHGSPGEKIAVVISGGNISVDYLSSLLAKP